MSEGENSEISPYAICEVALLLVRFLSSNKEKGSEIKRREEAKSCDFLFIYLFF